MLLDPDPYFPVRIPIQDSQINADPFGSGSTTLVARVIVSLLCALWKQALEKLAAEIGKTEADYARLCQDSDVIQVGKICSVILVGGKNFDVFLSLSFDVIQIGKSSFVRVKTTWWHTVFR
jgi:hypothetical protein